MMDYEYIHFQNPRSKTYEGQDDNLFHLNIKSKDMTENDILKSIQILDGLQKTLLFKENVQNNIFNVLYAAFHSENPLNDDIVFHAKYEINGHTFTYSKTYIRDQQRELGYSKDKIINDLWISIGKTIANELINVAIKKNDTKGW